MRCRFICAGRFRATEYVLRQDVGAADSAFGDYLGAAVVAFLVSRLISKGSAGCADNLWMASAIFIGSVVWILLLALLSQTISAWVKWRMAASAALLGLFFIPSVFARSSQRNLSDALGSHHQSGAA